MLRIRLRRVGKRHHPSYRMVVANQQAKRDGAFLETLGSYDPHANPPSMVLNEESARVWLGKGAQPSEAAEKILRRAGLITTPAKVAAAVAAAPAAGKKATEAPTAVAEAPEAEIPSDETPIPDENIDG